MQSRVIAAEAPRGQGGDDDMAIRLAFRYLEHEMPDADAETIERAARDFLAALQD